MTLLKTILLFLTIGGLSRMTLAQTTQPASKPTAPNPQPDFVAGTLAKVDGQELSIDTPDRGRVVVTVAQNGDIRLGLKRGTLADLKPGMKVSIRSFVAIPSGVIRQFVRVGDLGGSGRAVAPASEDTFGTVVTVDGNKLIVHRRGTTQPSSETTIQTDDRTQFLIDAAPGGPADIKSGMAVAITSVPAGAPGGPKLMVEASSPGRRGIVVRVEGTRIIITAKPRDGHDKEITIDTDANTSVVFPGRRQSYGHFEPAVTGALADVEPGEWVNVLPQAGVAAKIVCSRSKVAVGGAKP